MHTHYLLLYAFSDTVLINKWFFVSAFLRAEFGNVQIQCAFVLSTLKKVHVCPCGKIFDARIKNVTNPYMHLVTPEGVFQKKYFSLVGAESALAYTDSYQLAWGVLPIHPAGCASHRNRILGVYGMSGASIEQKALKVIAAFEKAGRSIRRVTLDGRKIELELSPTSDADEFERIDMRHDKT